MHRIRQFASLLLLTHVAVGGAAAQQRKPFFATVVGPDGAPLAGAEVTCAFTPDLVTAWPADAVTATSDERGRAQCDLVVGRIYTAWAIGAANERGERLVTAPVDLIAAGRVVELRAFVRAAPRTLPLVGADAWHEVGATALRWFPDTRHGVHVDLAWPDRGAIELPASPFAPGRLALVAGDGQEMVAVLVEADTAQLAAFAAPMAIDAIVVDDVGAPVAAAAIEYLIGAGSTRKTLLCNPIFGVKRMRRCGVTDATGRLRCQVPEPGRLRVGTFDRPDSRPLFASKPGFEVAVAPANESGEVAFRLVPHAPTTLQVAAGGLKVAALTASASYTLRARSGAMSGQRPLAVAEVSGPVWHVVAHEQGFWPHVAVDADTPIAFLTEFLERPGGEATLDLRSLTPTRIRVRDAAGGPVACAIGIAEAGDGSPVYWDAALATDLAGAATVCIPPDGALLVYATTGAAHGLALIERNRPRDEPVEVRLETLPTMRVLLRDAGGAPVVGACARIAEGGRSAFRSQDPVDRQLDRLCSDLWHVYAQVRTDASGVALVPAFVRPGMRAQLTMRGGEVHSEPFGLEPGGSVEVTLRE